MPAQLILNIILYLKQILPANRSRMYKVDKSGNTLGT